MVGRAMVGPHRSEITGADIARPPLRRVYVVLLLLLIVVSGVAALADTTVGYSILLGGLISVLPNSYFARQAFRYRGARAAVYATRAFYLGETGKFVMTAAAFAVVFARVEPLAPLALAASFVGMTITHLLVCARCGVFSSGRIAGRERQ
ncbi:MAG: ATP synthase subunit I [Spongiibacteraceae bacterium]|nr:ATP synthase subunit I [Spongiibacteraceae bacterium]